MKMKNNLFKPYFSDLGNSTLPFLIGFLRIKNNRTNTKTPKINIVHRIGITIIATNDPAKTKKD
jgi:hypothetical protein